MSNYTKSTNFATKDNLPTGDPLKIVKGTEIDTEFNNIATAISTKTDNASAAITGGSITGITDLAIADGGTGASTATAAINNLLPSQTSNANKYLQTDGTNVSWDAISINTGDITGTLPVANGGTGVTSSTGTGSVVLSNSPTLVTPSLGAATASTLDVSGNVTLSGGTANTIPYLNGSKVVTTGAELYFNGTNLGVGASASYRVDLGSATSDDAAVGIRIGRGGSSTTWSLIDNVGGSGNYRQYSSGTPTFRWLTSTNGTSWSEQMRLNATGLGVGNNNPTEKLDVTGSALVSGSVTATSFAGALNGTVGATTPTTGAFTTIAASGAVTLSGGTANGVTYLNGSKVLTSGSALTFDGTRLGIGSTANTEGILTVGTGTVTDKNGIVLYRGAASSVSPTQAAIFNELNGIGSGESLTLRSPAGFKFQNNDGSSEWMRLTSTGLGIGTSSVSTGLRLVKTPISSADYFNNTIASFETNTSDGLAIYRPAATTIGLKVNSSRDMVFGIGDQTPSEIMRMTTTGLGIGTSSPNRKLEVGGTSNAFMGFNSTSNRRYTTGSDANGFVVYDDTAGAYRTVIDASGNLGVGTTSPIRKLDVQGSGSVYASITNTTSGSGSARVQLFNNGDTSDGFSIINNSGASGVVNLLNYKNSDMAFWTNFTERARIDSSGNLLVGTTNTNPIGSNIPGFVVSSSGNISASRNGGASLDLNRYTSDGSIARFNRSSVQVGSIDVTTTATTYSTSSDYRLKNTIAPMTGALAKVALLKPVTYKWNVDGSDGEGFIAHELAEVCPHAVTGEKDAVDEEGNPKYQGIDTSFLVATLTAAIQELKAEFDAYKASHP